MKLTLGILFLSFLAHVAPIDGGDISLYQYFEGDGITQGLTAQGTQFQLNGKNFNIYSGSFHYFRVHPKFWRTRLQQYKAAGLNTVDVYVPWNLHEPQKGLFDFGSGSSKFSPFLNITNFLEMILEEDMFAILRPGPYICAEWEFGGHPSWLLHDHPMFFRSSYGPYQERAELYLHEVISRVKHLQFFTESGERGGPLIMTQIENEFGHYGYGDHPRDKTYLTFLKSVLRGEGLETLLFTSDTATKSLDWGSIDRELMTANFRWNSEEELKKINEIQPNKPILVSEYWPGWFDHWFGENHNTLSEDGFREILGNIFNVNGSVNFYMFHGGTNFGFMNGASSADFGGGAEVDAYSVPVVTSYDYNAPISESGHYTPKYYAAREMISANDPLYEMLIHPSPPEIRPGYKYPDVLLDKSLPYLDIIENIPEDLQQVLASPTAMEKLDINNGNGQSYGYIIYRRQLILSPGMVLKIRGHPRDIVQILVDGIQVNAPILTAEDILSKFGSWAIRDAEYTFDESLAHCESGCTLDLMVENFGRANFGAPHNFEQNKGLWEGDILLDDQVLEDWTHIAMEMKPEWLATINNWQPLGMEENKDINMGPKLLMGTLTIEEIAPEDGLLPDTFFDFGCEECQDLKHGVVFINGFNIGRYHQAGPQKTLYIPGPLLREGDNEIIVFEKYATQNAFDIKFADRPNYGKEGDCESSPCM